MNDMCKFECCAYAHTKHDNKVKIEILETKCSTLENEVKCLREEQKNVNPLINLMGKGIMKWKKEVERLTSICNDMNSKEETVRNENKMVEKEKSLDMSKEKRKSVLNTKILKKSQI